MENNIKIILFKKGAVVSSNQVGCFIYHDFTNVYPRLKKLENGDYEVIHDFAVKFKLITFD